jgi:diguanylate cyclase (GGDEF)-like protein
MMPQFHKRPILLLSAHADRAQKEGPLGGGIDLWIDKSSLPKDVVRAITANLSSCVQGPHDASIDALTGLMTRAGLQERYDQTLALARRCQFPITIAALNVDHLKALNQDHGRDMGDYALASLANWLSQNIRKADLLARWVGNQFVILLPGSAEAEAREACERFVLGVRTKSFSRGPTDSISFSVSVGISEITSSLTLDDAVAQAEWYLFHAKADGGDRIASKIDLSSKKAARILLASADYDALTPLLVELRADGFETATRPDGDATLATALSSDTDLLVIDLGLLGEGSLNIIKQIRRSKELRGIPILLLAPPGDGKKVRSALEDGADDFLMMPARPEDLSLRIKSLLRRAGP